MRPLLHYGLHFILPLLAALIFYRKDWKKAYLIFVATMLVDLDHLLADPIFDPNRCSINFHLLHTYYAMIAYLIMVFLKKPFHWIGLGLLMHMLADWSDCLMIK
ncbi:DUF6122 family protein [Gilvibacter sediminis]|uniref:DUF6122 family protein n=1 Tax=Gilvibacter sediminis TaxID=379071 RepID=UPI002350AF20|nr:DUF6122 family protein [Gilvibacter sediminis]MDC7997565.1 DUF6122 family protein [Gilvibacter sediminis]